MPRELVPGSKARKSFLDNTSQVRPDGSIAAGRSTACTTRSGDSYTILGTRFSTELS